MMYRIRGCDVELTAREVAELALSNIDDDACEDLRMGFSEWLHDHI